MRLRIAAMACFVVPSMLCLAESVCSAADIEQWWKKNLEARCSTALCSWSDGKLRYGIEAFGDVPFGAATATGGFTNSQFRPTPQSAFGDKLVLTVQAGIRFWLPADIVSVGFSFSHIVLKDEFTLYYATKSGDQSKTFSTSSLETAFPVGIVVGALQDLLVATFQYYRVRNDAKAVDYAPGTQLLGPKEEIASGWVITFGIAPVAGLRTLFASL